MIICSLRESVHGKCKPDFWVTAFGEIHLTANAYEEFHRKSA